MSDTNELFRENQSLFPSVMILSAAAMFPVMLLLMLFVLPLELEESERTALMCIAVIAPILYLIAFYSVFSVKTTVTYDFVTLKGRRVIPVENIESVTRDDLRGFKEFGADDDGETCCMFPYFGNPKGLRFKLKTGESGFIGSKTPSEFEDAVKSAMRRVKRNDEQ